MTGPVKTTRIQPRLPRGFADRGAAEIRAVDAMMGKIKAVYERYGFEPVETPFVEYTEALGKFLPDQDRPNEGVFSFQDEDEAWLSLRYDLTAPLARYVAENFDALPKPFRSYRAGWVFRNEKPGPGRFRQFMQFDADTVGSASPAADAEICMMAADTMEALGFERGQYVIKVNSRKVLDGVMEAIGVTDERQKLTVLRAIDKFDRLGWGEVVRLLGPGRLDESGDVTKGAGLSTSQTEGVLSLLNGGLKTKVHIEEGNIEDRPLVHIHSTHDEGFEFLFSDYDNVSRAEMLGRFPYSNERYRAGVESLASIAELSAAAGYDKDRIAIDPFVVRGLEYYTGPVFEAQLTFEVPNEKGEPVVFGSVGGGGRYDGLVGRFRGEDVPATGFSIGVSRLASALRNLGKLDAAGATGPVVVTVMDRARIGDYQKIVSDLRSAGIAAEMYLGSSGMKPQLKYADRRNSPCAIIVGSNEFEAGMAQVKDLIAGKAKAASIEGHEAWREERPGQFEVPMDGLVEAVRGILARQKS